MRARVYARVCAGVYVCVRAFMRMCIYKHWLYNDTWILKMSCCRHLQLFSSNIQISISFYMYANDTWYSGIIRIKYKTVTSRF